jgi:predicted metal-dependent TIM-barrel fold hydrolase
MRIFEPHAHMVARTTADYEAMARAGVEVVVEPAFWLGEPRKHAGSFLDYFEHLHNYEHQRAATYGIQQFVTLAMNPKESNNRELRDAVIKELPRFLDYPRVVAVGEIGFDAITPEEEDSFCRQAEMARKHALPLMIHSPHLNKKAGIERLFVLLKQMNFAMDHVLMDHNVEDTTPVTRRHNAWAGHTIYPISKVSPERMARILRDHGFERMMINAAPDWGASDPLMVPHTVDELRAGGAAERDIQKLVWDNPIEFFTQSGRLKLS